jgi:hypothetical protein
VAVELNWVAIQRQRYLVGLDDKGDVRALAYNKGDLHGKNGIDDPTGQRWYGFTLLKARELKVEGDSLDVKDLMNVHTSYGEVPDFTSIRTLIEEDRKDDEALPVVNPFKRG